MRGFSRISPTFARLTLFTLSWAFSLSLLASPSPVLAAQPINGSTIDPSTVLDPEEFPIPEDLRPAIAFWHKIFADYSSDQELLHDEVEMGVIYEVVDFSDLRQAGLSEGKIAIERKRRMQAETKRIADALRDLQAGREIPHELAHVRDVWSSHPGGSEKYGRALRNLRSQRGLKDHFSTAIETSGMFMPGIEDALARHDVPRQVRCMPFVESMFNYKARSKVGASGAWQFTRSTGRMYLKINSAIDERSDVLIAADGAARLLRDNYRRLKSWPLALTAYNHGTSGMARAVKQTGTRDIAVIARKYRSRTFGFASRNFYAEFVAAVLVFEDRKRLFPDVRQLPRLRFEEFVAPRYVSLPSLVAASGLDRDRLKELNPALANSVHNGGLLVPQGYSLKVPAGQLAQVSAAWETLSEKEKQDRQNAVGYRVRPGDTLGAIARRHRVPLAALQQANDLPRADRIYVGQRLIIPGRENRSTRAEPGKRVAAASQPANAGSPASAASQATTPAAGSHVVARGETLGTISQRYGVPAGELVRVNGLRNPDQLHVGQELEIPGGGDASVAGERRHTVRPGDTLFEIAAAYGVSVDRIKQLNRLRSSVIKVGEVLLVAP